MLKNQSVARIEVNGVYDLYSRIDNNRNHYIENEEAIFQRERMRYRGQINQDRSVTIMSTKELVANNEEEEEEQKQNVLPLEIIDRIEQGTAKAETDASMVETKIATHWIMSTKDNNAEKEEERPQINSKTV